MNYMEFLNKKSELSKQINDGQTTDMSSAKSAESNEVGSLFSEQSVSVQNAEAGSVFNIATQEDLQGMDFEQVIAKEAPQEENALTSLLRNFFSFDEIKKDADKDEDGEVSAEEAKNYLSEISAKDGDEEALSLIDLDNVIQEKNINLQEIFDNEAAAQSAIAPEVTPESPSGNVPSVPQSSQSASTSHDNSTQLISGFSSSRSSNSSGGVSSSYSQASYTPANPLDSMSLEQLETEKSAREATLKEKQDAVNAVNNGSNENIKAAVAEMKEAETAYKDAVKNDSNVDKKFKKALEKNLQKINENQAKLDDNAVKITNKEGEISTQEENIKSLNAEIESLSSQTDSLSNQISKLKSSLSGVGTPTGKPEDKDKDAAIKAKKNEISVKISEKTKELNEKKKVLDSKNKDLNNSNKKLDTLKAELDKLNVVKAKLDDEKDKLNTEKKEIETNISATCAAETKAKMTAYNKAVKNVESVKAKELASAKSAFTEAQNAVQEVNSKINEVKNRKVYDGDINTDNIPAKYKDQISMKTLSNGTQLLTFDYTKFKDLKPELQDQMALFNEIAAERGYTFVMSDGFRSIEESNAARARKGNMVAPGGSSPHNYGAAFDCGVYKNGGQGLSRSEWNEFAAEVKKRSNGKIAWGGDFKSKSYEVWHFELADWKKYKHS